MVVEIYLPKSENNDLFKRIYERLSRDTSRSHIVTTRKDKNENVLEQVYHFNNTTVSVFRTSFEGRQEIWIYGDEELIPTALSELEKIINIKLKEK